MNDINKDKNYVQRTWNILSSMQMGILLLLFLAIISTYAATFLEHDKALKLIYSSWWFIAGLILLILNLLICSVNRLPAIIKNVSALEADTDLKYLESLDNKANLSVIIKDDTINDLLGKLKKMKYRTSLRKQENSFIIKADKGRFGYLGSIITHVSLIILIASAFYGAVGSKENYAAGFPGKKIDLPMYDFAVRIDDFQITYRNDPEKSIEQYYSTLTVIEDGKEVDRETIYVNRPLRYKGVNFYQYTFGWGVDVKFTDTATGNTTEMLLLPDQTKYYPDMGIYIRMVQFLPDFAMTAEGQPYSKSQYPANPRVAFQFLDENEQIIGDQEYYIEQISRTLKPTSGFTMEFMGYSNYTGFKIVEQPGMSLLLGSSILLVLGLFMSFYLYPRKIWLYPEKGSKDVLVITGTSYRNKLGFSLEFKKLVKEIESCWRCN